MLQPGRAPGFKANSTRRGAGGGGSGSAICRRIMRGNSIHLSRRNSRPFFFARSRFLFFVQLRERRADAPKSPGPGFFGTRPDDFRQSGPIVSIDRRCPRWVMAIVARMIFAVPRTIAIEFLVSVAGPFRSTYRTMVPDHA